MSALRSRGLSVAAWCLPLLLAACATRPSQQAPQVSPMQIRAGIVRRMPTNVPDRDGWAADIQTAFSMQRIDPNPESICAVLAVIAQESGYQADPAVPNLPRIAREEIDRRAAAHHIPEFVVDAALKIRSPDGRSHSERLRHAHTERELSRIYEDLIASVPLGKRLFADFNPVQTGGPMQVNIAFAEANAGDYPYPVASSIRDEVFTRRGGVYFGIMRLLDYPTPYTRKVYRFADYNAGRYSSRNAAFQNAVSIVTGIPLARDGDLLTPGAPFDQPGETERALRTLSHALGMDARALRKALERSDRLDFDDTPLYSRIYALAAARAGKPLPRAMIPTIQLDSPKITRKLTTAWFAERVDDRYQRCMRQ
ncbi:MAG TPA: DUF1615 domain-containing protein [Rhodanobacteraceae bacterium]|jgi:hypothetical protein|nr:DUF1615 domain-containing protein [Rhodanobacteraceae bacterium]